MTTRLSFDSDGRPVDKAAVTVNGVLATETNPGTFQTTITTWSQLNVNIESPNFSPWNITSSGYATGNIEVEVAVVAILVVVLILLIRRRPSVPPPPPPPLPVVS